MKKWTEIILLLGFKAVKPFRKIVRCFARVATEQNPENKKTKTIIAPLYNGAIFYRFLNF